MADGSRKPIEEVAVGEHVWGLFGMDNEVLGLDRPRLGHRPLWRVNGDFCNTSDHMMWTGRRWAVLSHQDYLDADYRKPIPVILADGTVVTMIYHGIDPSRVAEVGVGDALHHVDGQRVIESLVAEEHPAMLPVFALVLGGSHSMFVGSGYAVSGWARDDDFDYEKGVPK